MLGKKLKGVIIGILFPGGLLWPGIRFPMKVGTLNPMDKIEDDAFGWLVEKDDP